MSNNALLSKIKYSFGSSNDDRMSINGVISKSSFLLIIASIIGIVLYGISPELTKAQLAATGLSGGLGALFIAIFMCFKQSAAKILAIPFAFCEGLLLGAITAITQLKYPGVPVYALLATFFSAAAMFSLYYFRIVEVGEKFKGVMYTTITTLFFIFVAQLVLSAFGLSIPGLFDNSIIGLVFAGIVAVVASLTLLLDFDEIEELVNTGAAKEYEWYSSISLLATLVWMYVSFLRFFGILSDD